MKMKKFIFLSVIFLLFLNGCKSSTESEDIFQFKNSYVGDNGAVGNITSRLPTPNGEQISGLELKTTEKPYGIILDYENKEITKEIEKNYKETALYNATFIFVLVQNVDWVQFNFVEQEYKITREELQKCYGKELKEFNNKEELSKWTQQYLQDENKVKQFLN